MKPIDYLRAAVAPLPKRNVLPRGITMLGDSIGNQVAQDLPVVNYCQPGDTARDAWTRLPYTHLIGDTVILQPGTNDKDDPVPYLERMVKRLDWMLYRVILTGITREAGTANIEVNNRISQLAADYGVLYANWGDYPVELVDGLHLTANGIEMLRSVTLRVIARLP